MFPLPLLWPGLVENVAVDGDVAVDGAQCQVLIDLCSRHDLSEEFHAMFNLKMIKHNSTILLLYNYYFLLHMKILPSCERTFAPCDEQQAI